MSFDTGSLPIIWSALGTAVLHFLWQGALIGLGAGLVLQSLRHRSSSDRYAVAGSAMLLCLLAFGMSFAFALSDLGLTATSGALSGSLAPGAAAGALSIRSGTTDIAAWCWVAGALFMILRFVRQCLGAHSLKTTAIDEPDTHWQRIFQSLKSDLGLVRDTRLLRSGIAQVPMVVGWFSPVVLVPASAFTGLSTDQLRSILAHELAHIRRNDQWLNAAQAVVEIVLFFHPVVWWISEQMRIEREYCCDDSSVRVTGDPRLLAEALTAMETLRSTQPMSQILLAANGGPLMQRIARILGARPDGRTSLAGWRLPAGFVLTGLLAVAGAAYAAPTLIDGADGVEQARDEAALEKVWAELQAAVKAGKMTDQEASEELGVYKDKMAAKKSAGQQTDRVDPKQVWAKLQAEVAAGKLTQEQARERFAAWEDKVAVQREQAEVLRRTWVELEREVAAGNLTKQQAKERIDALKQRGAKRDVAPKPEAVIREIAAAVEAGRLTPAQGKERIEAYRQSLANRKAASEAKTKEVASRIDAAVKKGEITPEQGKARMEAYLQHVDMEQAKPKEKGSLRWDTVDPKAAIKRIQSAVNSGAMTPEEGEAKIEAIKRGIEKRKLKKDVK